MWERLESPKWAKHSDHQSAPAFLSLTARPIPPNDILFVAQIVGQALLDQPGEFSENCWWKTLQSHMSITDPLDVSHSHILANNWTTRGKSCKIALSWLNCDQRTHLWSDFVHYEMLKLDVKALQATSFCTDRTHKKLFSRKEAQLLHHSCSFSSAQAMYFKSVLETCECK